MQSNFTPELIRDRLGSQLISHGVGNVALGKSPLKGLDQLGRSFLVTESMGIVQNGLGDLGKGLPKGSTWEGSLPHLLLHGGAGCVAMAAMNGKCSVGFFAAASQSVLAGSSLSDKDKQAIAPLAGAFAGYLLSDGKAINVSFGGTIAKSGFRNNYLFHAEAEKKNILAKLERLGCESGGASNQCAALRKELGEINKLNEGREETLRQACLYSMYPPACVSERRKVKLAEKSYRDAGLDNVLNDTELRIAYTKAATSYGEISEAALAQAGRKALREIPVDSATGLVDLAKVSAKAISGDPEAKAQLQALANATREFIKNPVTSTDRAIERDLDRADKLEAEGKYLEADTLRSKIVLNGVLTFTGGVGAGASVVKISHNWLRVVPNTGTVAPNNGSLLWRSWNDYPKVTIGGRDYAQIGGRNYSRHAVDRMQPSGLGTPAGADGPGRNVTPNMVEDVINGGSVRTTTVNGVPRAIYTSGNVSVVTEDAGRTIVTILRNSSP